MNKYIFPSIVMITALALAAGAALFTVLGFRELFEPSLKITYMAATIEFGKIIAVSALYQLRHILGWFWKSILFILILVAMAVTSMGVYGYLSSSYQKDNLAISQNEARIELIDTRQERLGVRLELIDNQIAQVPETYVSKRMELIETFEPEKEKILTELDNLSREESNIKLERIEQQTEFGAIVLLAESVDWLETSNAMLYFILAVIFIFDPLAIALTYSANVGFAHIVKKEEETNSVDQSNILNEVHSTIDDFKKEHEESSKPIVDAIKDLKNELNTMKTPSNRGDVLDSMRKQNS